jgi:tubulin polyglutamylase TTLL5
MDNKYIHLTNFSINRENIADKKLSLEQQLGGCKISLKMLKKRMHLSGVSWERIEKQIDEIILKSLIACMNVIPQNPNCF